MKRVPIYGVIAQLGVVETGESFLFVVTGRGVTPKLIETCHASLSFRLHNEQRSIRPKQQQPLWFPWKSCLDYRRRFRNVSVVCPSLSKSRDLCLVRGRSCYLIGDQAPFPIYSGLMMAHGFAENGATVYIGSRRKEVVEKAAGGYESKSKGKIIP